VRKLFLEPSREIGKKRKDAKIATRAFMQNFKELLILNLRLKMLAPNDAMISMVEIKIMLT
jgi:hypothetical protein